MLLAGVFIVVAGMELFVKKQPLPPRQFIEAKSSDAKSEAKVLAIASKFICSCGTCGEKPLDTCTCSRAAEERQFIRNYLEAGQTPEQVIAAVNTTFGWMKPELAARYNSGGAITARLKTPPVVAKQTEAVLAKLATKASANAKLATAADRIQVFSHFKCSCGQCGVDELKDCGCDHPRGATEVKAFVDAKITEGKYTVGQVLDQVEREYGGRKFQ